MSFVRQAITLREKWMGDACVRGRLCNTPGHWGRNLIRFLPAQRSCHLILSKPSGKAGHGSFPMRVVGSLTTNNLVRTNHTDFYFVSTRLHFFISVL